MLLIFTFVTHAYCFRLRYQLRIHHESLLWPSGSRRLGPTLAQVAARSRFTLRGAALALAPCSGARLQLGRKAQGVRFVRPRRLRLRLRLRKPREVSRPTRPRLPAERPC